MTTLLIPTLLGLVGCAIAFGLPFILPTLAELFDNWRHS